MVIVNFKLFIKNICLKNIPANILSLTGVACRPGTNLASVTPLYRDGIGAN